MRLVEAVHRRWIVRRRLAALERLLAPLVPDRGPLLDIGSGTGELAWRLATLSGIEVVGLDVLVQPHTRIPVQKYDGVTLPFPDDSFATVLLCDVIHHADDPSRLLREAHRVAPVLIVKDHQLRGPLSRARLAFMDHVGNDRFGIAVRAEYWRPERWHEEFASSSWRVEHWSESLDLYPFPFSLVFDASLHFVSRLERAAA